MVFSTIQRENFTYFTLNCYVISRNFIFFTTTGLCTLVYKACLQVCKYRLISLSLFCLQVVPAANKVNTNKIGGRVRGPSPLVDQWIEFCLQAARALPFQEGVIPGASPFAIVGSQVECGPFRSSQGKPKLETNLEAGVPPLDILAKCEFLEPLSNQANSDYKWLIGEMQKSNKGRMQEVWDCTLSFVCSLLARAHG